MVSSKVVGAVVLVGELGAVLPGVDDGLGPPPGVFFLIDRRRLAGSVVASAFGAAKLVDSATLGSLVETEERLGVSALPDGGWVSLGGDTLGEDTSDGALDEDTDPRLVGVSNPDFGGEGSLGFRVDGVEDSLLEETEERLGPWELKGLGGGSSI